MLRVVLQIPQVFSVLQALIHSAEERYFSKQILGSQERALCPVHSGNGTERNGCLTIDLTWSRLGCRDWHSPRRPRALLSTEAAPAGPGEGVLSGCRDTGTPAQHRGCPGSDCWSVMAGPDFRSSLLSVMSSRQPSVRALTRL